MYSRTSSANVHCRIEALNHPPARPASVMPVGCLWVERLALMSGSDIAIVDIALDSHAELCTVCGRASLRQLGVAQLLKLPIKRRKPSPGPFAASPFSLPHSRKDSVDVMAVVVANRALRRSSFEITSITCGNQAGREVGGRQYRAFAEEHRPLECVVQLADVPRPSGCDQTSHRRVVHAVDSLSQARRLLGHECRDQSWNVFAAIS